MVLFYLLRNTTFRLQFVPFCAEDPWTWGLGPVPKFEIPLLVSTNPIVFIQVQSCPSKFGPNSCPAVGQTLEPLVNSSTPMAQDGQALHTLYIRLILRTWKPKGLAEEARESETKRERVEFLMCISYQNNYKMKHYIGKEREHKSNLPNLPNLPNFLTCLTCLIYTKKVD
ncbi:hypothetical protein DVH24_041717 [Malus domestica]|uniref:Uncharacterized protein n=1 Tax=Malus domestica TaxID=3750 RepID=A0A498IP62_MALDO|nr:hypothetical protein DVH24_041717 [Malus domestica]